jgi:AcrR family transcriptional regulator
MSVEDIIATAGVSRRTFYDHFKSKDDAFLGEYEQVSAELIERVRASNDPEASFIERAEAGLHATLEFFQEDVAYADLCVVEVMAAGRRAVEKRDSAMAALAALVDESASDLPKRSLPPAITSRLVVGGIYEVIYTNVLNGKLDELPGLVPDMIFNLVLPYLGREEAVSAQKKARKRLK